MPYWNTHEKYIVFWTFNQTTDLKVFFFCYIFGFFYRWYWKENTCTNNNCLNSIFIFYTFRIAYNCVLSQWNLGGKFSNADLKYWIFVPVKIKSHCKYTYLVTSFHKENYFMISQIYLGIKFFPVVFSFTILCIKCICFSLLKILL